ncbi:MAG: hypothetical protein FD131_3358 [Rhodocyclaceae bacterium]|nr:MAG: hypothetical protein FD131_3358 [Rhodocyclaceae bacterium]
MIKRANTLIFILISGAALAQQPVDNAPIFQFNQRADASALAEKYAALLKDDPVCDIYRDQLVKLAKGNPYDGRTAPQMTQVLYKARGAGCHK